MVARRRIGLAVMVPLALAVAVETGAAPSQKARVIDRTMQCSISPQAGVRELHVYAQSGVRDQSDRSKWLVPANAGFGSGGSGPQVGVVMRPRPEIPGGNDSRARTFAIDDLACRLARISVPLSPRGLVGGTASQLGERFECVVPRRVLVRVRAEFREPVSLRRETTAVALRSGRFAVRAVSGKPIVYADVIESGRAGLFLAGSCVRD